jgi:hypothetical protein
MLPPYLNQTDIRALAGVCVTLRMIFRHLMRFKVTILRDDSPKNALRKALAVTCTSTILDSVVEVNIGKSTDAYKDYLGSYKIPHRLIPAFNTLANALPAMSRLHTIQLNSIILSRTYLHTILSAPYPIHLILDTVQLPKISTFPPTKLRKLTLTGMSSWETVQPFIAQLASSLEYLELQRCKFRPPTRLQLPSFPCLHELHHYRSIANSTFLDNHHLNELLRLGPHITHLYVSGHFENEPVTACQESLQYLYTSIWMLSEHIFGTEPFPRLLHLTLRFSKYADTYNYLSTPSSFIRDHFPTITSLHLSIPWGYRNHAMVIARSQYNVQALKLVTYIHEGMNNEAVASYFPAEVLNYPLHQGMLPMALQTLELEVDQYHGDPEQGAIRCSRWVFDDVVPPVTGLGGTGLKSIRLLVSQPKSRSVARERVLSRQWVKLPNDDWQKLE